MFIQHLLKRKQTTAHDRTASYVSFLVLAIVVATVGLRLYNWVNDGSDASLLSHDPAMIELSNVADIASHTTTSIELPIETFGASPFVIGVYPKDGKSFPANSVAIIFVKDRARSFEMDVIPNQTLEQIEATYAASPQEPVVVRDGTNGTFIRLRHDDVVCKHPRDTSHPSFCPFKTLLAFERSGSVIRLASDGDRLSDGELLKMARSIE